MKRKSTITLALALIGSTGLLASCAEPVDTAAFKDVDQCVKSGKYTSDTCEKAFAEAKIDNEKNAPAFKTKEDCEETFGANQCQTTPTTHPAGGGNFMPLMTGFLIGNMMSNNSGSQVYPQAIYQDRERRYVNSGGAVVTKNWGSVKVTPSSSYRGTSASSPPASRTTISRGGFGRSSFSVGG